MCNLFSNLFSIKKKLYIPEGVLCYFHTYVGSGYFFGFKILNFNIFLWFSEKMNIFWGYEDFVDIFFWSSQNWASLRVISMHFMVIFKVNVQNWDFWGLLKFQIFFWSAWNSWYFLGWTLDAESEPTYEETIRVPPPHLAIYGFLVRRV